MKTVYYALAASVILNIALAIYLKPFSANPVATSLPAKTSKIQTTQNASLSSAQTDSPQQLKQKLEKLGLPAEDIRAIMLAHIQRIYSTRQNAITGENQDRPYWQSERGISRRNTPDAREKLINLGKDIDKLVQKTFGDDSMTFSKLIALVQGGGQTVSAAERYSELPPETHAQVDTVNKRYSEQMSKFAKNYEAATTPEAREQLTAQARQYQQEREAELAKILTPEDLHEYNLRNGPGAQYYKFDTYSMSDWNVTETEYRAMFPAYQAFMQNTRDGYENEDVRKEAERQLQADLKQTLGDERYADYLQAKDPDNKKLNLIVQRLNLPLSAAREVVSVQNNLTARAATIGSDTSLTSDQRAANYAALAQEAQTRITQTLGPRGYAAYRENSKNWIQTLESGKPPEK